MPRAATSTDAFNAIAERRRRDILIYLARRERVVSEIVVALGLTQPAVSKHLRVLRMVGLVRARRDGRRIFYRTNAQSLRGVYDWLRRFEGYCGRTWWAHFEFTRINIEPIVFREKIEDPASVHGFAMLRFVAAIDMATCETCR